MIQAVVIAALLAGAYYQRRNWTMSKELTDAVAALKAKIDEAEAALAAHDAKVLAALEIIKSKMQSDPEVATAVSDIAALTTRVSDATAKTEAETASLDAAISGSADGTVPLPKPDAP